MTADQAMPSLQKLSARHASTSFWTYPQHSEQPLARHDQHPVPRDSYHSTRGICRQPLSALDFCLFNRRITIYKFMRWYIFCNNSSGSNQCPFTNCMSANHSGISPYTGSMLNNCLFVILMAFWVFSSWGKVISKNARWTAKYIVLNFYALINSHIILNLYAISDFHIVGNIDVLTQ